MKHDTADLGGRATEWSNVPMLLILVCIALGYLASGFQCNLVIRNRLLVVMFVGKRISEK
jgi:uncharacterized membrane protein YwzB